MTDKFDELFNGKKKSDYRKVRVEKVKCGNRNDALNSISPGSSCSNDTESVIFDCQVKKPARRPRKDKAAVVKEAKDGRENSINLEHLIDRIEISDAAEGSDCAKENDSQATSLSDTLSSKQAGSKKKKKHRNRKKKDVKEREQETNAESVDNSEDSFLQLTNKCFEKEKKPAPVKTSFAKYLPSDFINGILEGKLDDGNTYITGVLRINPRFYKHAFLPMPDDDEDLLIDGLLDRNRALEGDRVVARVNPEAQWVKHENGATNKTGVVVYILEKVHSRKVVGTLKYNKSKWLLQPRDSRLPILSIVEYSVPIFVRKQPVMYNDHLFVADLFAWNTIHNAFGRIKLVLGEKGDIAAETDAILMENNLCILPYSKQLLRDLLPLNDTLNPKDIVCREDWREECVFTIDPATACDLDDAVSCKLLDNGNYEVGVHISDVTHYLKEFSDLDEKVAQRATTVYLADKVYHMLPEQLCQVCSLLPGADKLTFSVIWEMTPDAKPIKHRFAKTVINSCCQLSYDVAQKMIENPSANLKFKQYGNHSTKQIIDTVIRLNELAVQMRKRRFDGGALRIDQPKICIQVDRISKQPVSFKMEEMKDSNRLIEEFMLLANMTVAEELYTKFPEYALLRCHKDPSPRMMRKTLEMLDKLGVCLSAESAGALQNSMNEYRENCQTSRSKDYKMMVINTLCVKSMSRATYICTSPNTSKDNFKHYALNVPLYTHFTSPMRRYADCVVHRLLNATVNQIAVSEKWNPALCNSIAKNCNVKKYNAKLAQDQSAEIYFAYYLQLTKAMTTTGVVLEIKEAYLDVILCEVGLKIRIFYADIKHDASIKYQKDVAPYIQITWKTTNEIQDINVFDVINLKIDKHPNQYRIQGRILP